MAKLREKHDFRDPTRGPTLSVRFAIAVVLIVLGVAWIAYYYLAVRVDPTAVPAPSAASPRFMADLAGWNYLIGFGALLLGLAIAAHPSTPLGRGNGVVAGMLGCFLIGLVWICVFYIFSNDLSSVPVFNDLGQKNLFVGIAFMAVGFTFATRWE